MGGQAGGAGGAKSKTPPNPNFGGGLGTDNSNGVYNGVQSATATGTAPMTTSTNPAAATATPSQTTSASAVPANKGTSKGQQPPAPAGAGQTPQQTAQSSYASTMGAALKGQPVPLPEGTTMGAMGQVWTDEDRKRVAEGEEWRKQNPNWANPTLDPNGMIQPGEMQRGIVRMPGSRGTTDTRTAPQVPGATTDQRQQQPTMMNYDQWLASRPAGQPLATNDYQAYTETFNQPKQGVGTPPPATGPASPPNPWGGTGLQQKLQAKGANPQTPLGPSPTTNTPAAGANPALTGGTTARSTETEAMNNFGTTQQQALDALKANPDWGAKLNRGEANLFQLMHPGQELTQDWQGLIKKMSGNPNADPIQVMKQMAADTKRGSTSGNIDFRQVLERNGLDPKIGAQLMNAFGTSGADSEQAAKRLGIYDQWKAGGAQGLNTRDWLETVTLPGGQQQLRLKAGYKQNWDGSVTGPDGKPVTGLGNIGGSANAGQAAARAAEEQAAQTASAAADTAAGDANKAKLKAWAESDNPDDPTGYMPGSPQDRQVRAARAARIAAKGTAPNDTATEHQRGT